MEEFKYTPDTVKDCINDTERRLRSLISDVLSDNYGKNWQKSKFGWGEGITSLEKSREEEQKRFFFKKVSEDLMDYSYLLDLKTLVIKNWSLFSTIFRSKTKFELFMNILNDIRNPEMHSRNDILVYERYLCLGICGEMFAAIERWRGGFSVSIDKYKIEFDFISKIEHGDKEKAELKSNEEALKWIDNIVAKTGGSLEKKDENADGVNYLLRMGKSHLKVKLSHRRNLSIGVGTSLCFETNNCKIINKLVENSKQAYRTLEFHLSDNLDLDFIVNRIKEIGRTPSSSVMVGNNKSYTNADYSIGKIGIHNFRVSLDRSIIRLSCDDFDFGFYRAHEFLLVEKIISILYGELTPKQVSKILEESTSKD